jgi:hypothetical protein
VEQAESGGQLLSALAPLPLDVDAAMANLIAVIKSCARSADMLERRPGPKSPRAHHKPWFDDECKLALRTLNTAIDNHQNARDQDTATAAEARVRCERKAFHSTCKRKKLAYKRQMAYTQAEAMRSDPDKFWKTLFPCNSSHLAHLADPHTCNPYFISQFQPPPTDPSHPPPIPPELGSLSDDGGSTLNAPITEEEVTQALQALKDHKAAGCDGLAAEFLKYAAAPSPQGTGPDPPNPLVPPLTHIFNHVLSNADTPSAWHTTIVTLLFKKGDPTLWSNYRPIAVITVLSKLFATLLNARLRDWCEHHGKRNPVQTGFRPHHSTSHHAFVLSHIIDKRRRLRNSKPLYVCFVDLAKAYDSVPRHMLWTRLYNLGIRGRMLHAIISMYRHADLSIKLADGLLDPFEATAGVKQGCPLSPLLFGLFIEALEEHVTQQHPELGPTIGDAMRRLRLLMYADDTAILADRPEDLQTLINATQDWCTANGMSINVTKTEVVVFRKSQHGTQAIRAAIERGWQLGGQPITVSDEFKYLGYVFHAWHRNVMRRVTEHAASRGKLAIVGLYRKLHDLDVGKHLDIILRLYRCCVMPALFNGSELSGGSDTYPSMPVHRTATKAVCEGVQRTFLRTALKLAPGTPSWIVYRECGIYPAQYYMLRRQLKFLLRVLQLDDAEYVKCAMLENIGDTLAAGGCVNWFSRLCAIVRAVDSQASLVEQLHVATFNVDDIMLAWRQHYHNAVWHGLPLQPLEAASDQIRRCTYHVYFARDLPDGDAEWRAAHYFYVSGMPFTLAVSLARFRTGGHKLMIERGRHLRMPRLTRTCTLCDLDRVQNEEHFILHCPHLDHLRARYPSLFSSAPSHMHEIYKRTTRLRALASFTHAATTLLGDPLVAP